MIESKVRLGLYSRNGLGVWLMDDFGVLVNLDTAGISQACVYVRGAAHGY